MTKILPTPHPSKYVQANPANPANPGGASRRRLAGLASLAGALSVGEGCALAEPPVKEPPLPDELGAPRAAANICAHCGRPGGNQASLGEGLIYLHRECEAPYRSTR
jgi:hypothetical protein